MHLQVSKIYNLYYATVALQISQLMFQICNAFSSFINVSLAGNDSSLSDKGLMKLTETSDPLQGPLRSTSARNRPLTISQPYAQKKKVWPSPTFFLDNFDDNAGEIVFVYKAHKHENTTKLDQLHPYWIDSQLEYSQEIQDTIMQVDGLLETIKFY